MKTGRKAEPQLLKIVENKEIQDNWQQYKNYAETRYLDALGSIHSVARPCAAISLSLDKQKHWLSYNENVDLLVKNKIAMIQELLQDPTQQIFDNLLGFYLCFNVNFRPTLHNYYNSIPRADKNKTLETKNFCTKINIFCTKIANTRKVLESKIEEVEIITSSNIQKIKPTFVEISADYLTLLENNQKELIIIPIGILRPYQDIIKLLRLTTKLNFKNISTLENPEKVHAELNIPDHSDYIGVSILCCYACDSGLNQEQIPHRGTSNLLFPDNEMYDTTNGTEIPYAHGPTHAQRRMSTDSEYEDPFLTSLKALYLSGETNDETN